MLHLTGRSDERYGGWIYVRIRKNSRDRQRCGRRRPITHPRSAHLPIIATT